MKEQLQNERGLTLIEVLAAFAVGMILILLIGSTLLFGLKQYNNQSVKAQELADVTYVAKVITKEIRKATLVSVHEANHTLKLTIDESEVEYKYDARDKVIYKNRQHFYSGIEKFTVSFSDRNENLLKIAIECVNEKGRAESIKTEIYVRGDVNNAKLQP